MEKTKVRMLIIAGKDNRRRYRYVAEPLESVGAEVEVCAGSGISWLFSLAKKAARLAHADNGPTAIVFMGAVRSSLFVYLVVRATYRGCVMSRWGGDSLQTRRDAIERMRENRMHLHRLALWVDIISAKIILRCSQGLMGVTNHTCYRLGENAGRNVPCYRLPQYRGDLEKLKHKPKVRTVMPGTLNLLTVTNLGYGEKFLGVLKLIELVSAYSSLRNGRICFTIAGGGITEAKLRRYISSRSFQSSLHIDFRGFVGDLETLYEAADIFVYCSELDGLPNVLMEAMAYGLPMLLNDYEDYREFFKQDKNCIYYNREDYKSFCKALERLDQDADLYNALSVNNARGFSEIFGLRPLAREAQRIISDLAASS